MLRRLKSLRRLSVSQADFGNLSYSLCYTCNMKTPKNATEAGPSYQKNLNYVLNDQVRAAIRGAIAEIDLEQVAISKKLTPADRAFQAASMIEAAEDVAVHRLQLRHPDVTKDEAYRIVRSGQLMNYELKRRAAKEFSRSQI